jgi:hypothetical protein
MPYTLAKRVLPYLLAAMGVFPASRAAAQPTTTAATPLAASDFTVYLESYDPGSKQWGQMNATTQQFFFNRARCECDADKTNFKGSFKVALQPGANTVTKIQNLLAANLVTSGSARLYAGGTAINCLDVASVPGGNPSPYCLNLLDPTLYSAGFTGGMTAFSSAGHALESSPIPVAWLFNSTGSTVCSGAACDATANCASASVTVNIYVWLQTNSTATPDITTFSFPVNLVGQVAYAPTNVTAEGGNEALIVNWGWPTSLTPSSVNSTFLGLQLFCVRGADNQVFDTGAYGAGFMSASQTCPNVAPATSSAGITGLDPSFLCSGLLPSTQTSYRIWKLQNGITYGVGVAAVDKYGNLSQVSEIAYGTPIPTVDFYSLYKDTSGGAAQGGFCAFGKDHRRPGLVALAALAGLGLVLCRRRRRRGPGAGPLAVLLVTSALAAGPARAQAAYDDMDVEQEHAGWQGSPRNYAIEARFGLYTPAIDSEFSGKQVIKPQSFIFGNKRRPMWQLEFDWEVFQEFGTLALGGVVGYYKENASACVQSALTTTGECQPSGDNTSLRLIPLAALVVYRFDVLAEQWKIPLVPYGKAGLNYTIWTITDGNGNIPSAGGGHGQGGTMGWQASVGLALQLDFLDPSTARGFDSDSGVNHTYAFFELDTIQSSGLGTKNALHVGDNTWFAGLMFEF